MSCCMTVPHVAMNEVKLDGCVRQQADRSACVMHPLPPASNFLCCQPKASHVFLSHIHCFLHLIDLHCICSLSVRHHACSTIIIATSTAKQCGLCWTPCVQNKLCLVPAVICNWLAD